MSRRLTFWLRLNTVLLLLLALMLSFTMFSVFQNRKVVVSEARQRHTDYILWSSSISETLSENSRLTNGFVPQVEMILYNQTHLCRELKRDECKFPERLLLPQTE